jgi:hypothetical protein
MARLRLLTLPARDPGVPPLRHPSRWSKRSISPTRSLKAIRVKGDPQRDSEAGAGNARAEKNKSVLKGRLLFSIAENQALHHGDMKSEAL